MKKHMRFGVLVEKEQAIIKERELPLLGPHQVLVRQKACNICTTDYGQWQGLREHQGYPMAGGHESAGIIEAVGAAVKDFAVGDHVGLAYDGCGECLACRSGDFNFCTGIKERRTKDGYLGTFGFADYCVRNTRAIVKMNPDLDFSEAAFVEPLATVVKGMEKIRLQPLETVLVIGGGTMGLLNALAAKAMGARVIIAEIMENKLETAKEAGIEVIDAGNTDTVQKVKEFTDGMGADVVIVAVGSSKANEQALQAVKQLDGRILYFAAGYPVPEIKIDSNVIHYRRLELIGTYLAEARHFQFAAKLLNMGAVDVSCLIEERKFQLDDIQNAFAYASIPGKYRVSVLL